MTDSNPLAYSPALESRETANLRANYQLFVDGEFTEGAGEPLRITEPATGELLTEVASANKSDVDKAVGAARRAFEQTWSRMPGRERGKHLFRIARLLRGRAHGRCWTRGTPESPSGGRRAPTCRRGWRTCSATPVGRAGLAPPATGQTPPRPGWPPGWFRGTPRCSA